MYAIIRTGGKQAKVRPGDVIDVELLKTDDESVSFTPLLVVDESGDAITERSKLSDLTVTAKVLGETKGQKIDIFKYKNKTGYSRRMGHRQRYTQLEVTAIGSTAAGADNSAPKKEDAKTDTAAKAKATKAEPVAAEADASSEEE
jgi:large subunit ribosomal protein L21